MALQRRGNPARGLAHLCPFAAVGRTAKYNKTQRENSRCVFAVFRAVYHLLKASQEVGVISIILRVLLNYFQKIRIIIKWSRFIGTAYKIIYTYVIKFSQSNDSIMRRFTFSNFIVIVTNT